MKKGVKSILWHFFKMRVIKQIASSDVTPCLNCIMGNVGVRFAKGKKVSRIKKASGSAVSLPCNNLVPTFPTMQLE